MFANTFYITHLMIIDLWTFEQYFLCHAFNSCQYATIEYVCRIIT